MEIVSHIDQVSALTACGCVGSVDMGPFRPVLCVSNMKYWRGAFAGVRELVVGVRSSWYWQKLIDSILLRQHCHKLQHWFGFQRSKSGFELLDA